MRQLAAYQKGQAELCTLGCTILAASVDTEEQARRVAESQGLTFPIAYGCTKEDAATIGAWWGQHPPDGGHIQPAEFLLGRGGTVLGSLYASGPIGRIGVDEMVRSITGRERRRLEQERQQPTGT